VITHEVGHHIQTLLGTSQKVHARSDRIEDGDNFSIPYQEL
jgi:predicted metalloprotease